MSSIIIKEKEWYPLMMFFWYYDPKKTNTIFYVFNSVRLIVLENTPSSPFHPSQFSTRKVYYPTSHNPIYDIDSLISVNLQNWKTSHNQIIFLYSNLLQFPHCPSSQKLTSDCYQCYFLLYLWKDFDRKQSMRKVGWNLRSSICCEHFVIT